MGKFKPEKVTTTACHVRHGVELCRQNARRLIRNARILLDHQGSDGLAYALWSLAVEEVGKAALLESQLPATVGGGEAITVTLSKDHDEKLNAGLRVILGLQNQRFEPLLRVTSNTGRTSTIIPSPHKAGVSVAVGSGATGAFSDASSDSELEATTGLRFDLLYVGWKPEQGRFGRPGETLRLPTLSARWELNREDLLEALNAVDAEVKEATT